MALSTNEVECQCGERGEGSAGCSVFGHSPFDKTTWVSEKVWETLTKVDNGFATDPEGRFYFFDETGGEARGPYDTLEDAKAGCRAYARDCL